ncbi:hypothetical protein HHK36_003562 [Tetracentron sinense]|uniref:Transcription factor GTE4 n=1 Tax=Tetracentron sinense TaxID=13715 RepID=A0A834ZTM5_TETSI|nr:hypothetical protein HHK36_003562 [Tetracentron sinense]
MISSVYLALTRLSNILAQARTGEESSHSRDIGIELRDRQPVLLETQLSSSPHLNASASEAAPPVIKPSDDELSLADVDTITVLAKPNGGIVQHKWTDQFFALKIELGLLVWYMASGPLVGGGGGDGSREKQRWTESKVYTRKAHKGPKNVSQPSSQTQTLAVEDGNSSQQQLLARFDAASDDSSSLNRRQVAVPNSRDPPAGNGSDRPVFLRLENRVTISLSSRSKQEMRELRRKLVNELGQVRNLVKKLEARDLPLTGCSGGGYSHSQMSANDVIDNGGAKRVNSEVASVGVAKRGNSEVASVGVAKRGNSEVASVGGAKRVNSEVASVGVAKRVNSEVASVGGAKRVNSEVASVGVAKRVNSEVASVGVAKRVNSEVASVGPHDSRPRNPLSISVVENSLGVSDFVEKEKRTPKANQYYRNSDFVLGKEKFPPPESNKKSKSNGGKKHGGGGGGEMDYGFGMNKYYSQAFKSCSNLLSKLMKHKHGWVFNTPVDVKSLGLHDYHIIIKHPMDLGTVKCRLNKNWYKTPREFAEDVRLTFHNAMTYNPKGQDVHVMAEQLSNIFEDRWAVIQAEFNLDSRFEVDHDAGLPTPTSRMAPAEMRRTLDRSESMTLPVDSTMKPSNFGPSGRTPAPKKPKAKDPHKRDMTYEEKQRLSTNLQSLPSEKLDNIVQIIKKRNLSLCQHDDEIEVDIDSVDTETLWELDRFVTNYKKSLSKNKRKAELAIQARTEAKHSVQNPLPAVVGAPKETKTDEKNVSASSPLQGEKQGDNASRSSSSSSSSSDSGSSSSDSDSESSSAFGSDAGHSPRT